MKRFLLPLIISTKIFALNLIMTGAKEDNKNYSTINLIYDEPFICRDNRDSNGYTIDYLCEFNKKPKEQIIRSENRFFKVTSFLKDDKFYLLITPKQKSTIIANNLNLKNELNISTFRNNISKHWSLIGYESENIPLLQNLQKKDGLKFPINIQNIETPYIGSLDINKIPIEYEDNGDIGFYLDIKKSIKNGDYNSVLSSLDGFEERYPDSIFQSEFILFKIKALNEVGKDKESDIIELAKAWMKKYPSDENLPEVLTILARNYSKIGMSTDANYYFERVINDHYYSKFSDLAKVYYADHKLSSGSKNAEAIKLYQEALYNTKDLEIASLSAVKLGNLYLELGELDKGLALYEKIFSSNMDFFFKDLNKAREFISRVAEKGGIAFSAKVGNELLNRVNKLESIYEVTLKDVGIWLDDSKNADSAIAKYKQYLEELPFGLYAQEIQKRYDKLLFETNSDSFEAQIKYFDELIEKYATQDIAHEALYKKAKLLFDNKKFKDVLDLENELKSAPNYEAKNSKELIELSAKELAQNSLQNRDCKQAVSTIKKYSVKVDTMDKELFYCFLDSGELKMAQDIVTPHIKDSDLNERLFWLYNSSKLLLKNGDYKNAMQSSKDVLALAQNLKQDKYSDVIYTMFDAYKGLKDSQNMLETAVEIKKNFAKNIDSLAVYREVTKIGIERKDDILTNSYAKKIIDLQNSSGVYLESPFAEFSFMQSALNLKKEAEAIDVGEAMLKKGIDNKDKVRVLYMLGLAHQKSNSIVSKEKFSECVDMNVTSSWGNLCKEALKLVE